MSERFLTREHDPWNVLTTIVLNRSDAQVHMSHVGPELSACLGRLHRSRVPCPHENRPLVTALFDVLSSCTGVLHGLLAPRMISLQALIVWKRQARLLRGQQTGA